VDNLKENAGEKIGKAKEKASKIGEEYGINKEKTGEKIGQAKEKASQYGNQSNSTWDNLKESTGEKIGQAKEKVSKVGEKMGLEGKNQQLP